MSTSTSKNRPTLIQSNPSIPSYLKPNNSSSKSKSKSRSGSGTDTPHPPHNQQHEYVPSFDDIGLSSNGIIERALFSENNTPISTPQPGEGNNTFNWESSQDQQEEEEDQEHQEEEEGEEEEEEKELAEWKKPSPKWLYPFIIGVPLCIGMSIAPKTELFINLACLAHPPSAKQDSTYTGYKRLVLEDDQGNLDNNNINNYLQSSQIGLSYHGLSRSNPSNDLNFDVSVGLEGDYELSPADKWFLKLQRDIYEYKLHHSNSSKLPSTSKPIIAPSPSLSRTDGPEPTSPLPRPDKPFPSDKDKDKNTNSPYPSEDKDKDDNDGHRPYEEIDPRLCKKDAKVQAAAARLTMIMTLTMGLLSALTTGFWGQTSDKLGRTKIIAAVEIGLLLNEICFILVANFPHLVPGGYRFLLLGPTIEGLLGGYSTISATINAYVSDVTPDGSRVTIFARISGIFMAGFAVGPVLGSLLIKWTGDIMTPFYLNAIIYACYLPLILFILPESLSSEARKTLAKNAKIIKEETKKRDQLEREWENETPSLPNGDGTEEVDPLLSGWSRMTNINNASKARKRTLGKFKRIFRKLFRFLQPLTIFIPIKNENEKRRDWNLTVVGAGLFFMSMVFGIMTMKAQYTFYAYGWTSAQLGPFMSLTAFSRSFVLIAIVPAVMHYVKPRFLHSETNTKATAGHPTIDEEVIESAIGDPNSSAITDGTTTSTGSKPIPPPEVAKGIPKRSAHLDLITIRFTLLLETIPYLLLALSPSPIGFIILSILTTFGGPATPAANSLALSLLNDSNQSGRLFGGLSVLNAIGSNLISPLLFGLVFSSTVGTYAATIFAIAVIILIAAQICFAFVRLDKKNLDVEEQEEGNNNGNGNNRDVSRGRSKKVKRVNSSSFTDRGSTSASASGSGISRINSEYGSTGETDNQYGK